MRFIVLSLAVIWMPLCAAAFEIEDRIRLGDSAARATLRVISTADWDVFRQVIDGYLAHNPDLAVDYVVVSSSELMKAIAEEGAQFDIAISSAMDLQTKLANDRMTLPHVSDATRALPEWARWRQDLFAFTQEPAALVLSRAAFAGLKLPKSRQALIETLRQHPDRFRGKVGTYDLRKSGAGYLFATQDSRTSEVFWRLTEVMGGLDARLYCCSSDMLDDIASGELAVAYNALATYAQSRSDAELFEVVYPSDFTTIMMRTVTIPATARNTQDAAEFIDYLLQLAWETEGEAASPLDPLKVDLRDVGDAVKRIRIDPGLLIYLDAYKRKRFLSAWLDAILQD